MKLTESMLRRIIIQELKEAIGRDSGGGPYFGAGGVVGSGAGERTSPTLDYLAVEGPARKDVNGMPLEKFAVLVAMDQNDNERDPPELEDAVYLYNKIAKAYNQKMPQAPQLTTLNIQSFYKIAKQLKGYFEFDEYDGIIEYERLDTDDGDIKSALFIAKAIKNGKYKHLFNSIRDIKGINLVGYDYHQYPYR